MTLTPPPFRRIPTVAPRAMAPIAPIAPIEAPASSDQPDRVLATETAQAPALYHPERPKPPLATVKISEQRQDVSPFFDGPVRLTKWNTSPSSGYTLTFRIDTDELVNPFKGLSATNKAGQRLLIIASVGGQIVYEDQAILTYYGDDSRKGMTVAFKLCVSTGEHPFQGYNAADDASGAFFRLRAWIVLDDERYAERRSRPFDELSPVAQAHIKSNDRYFQSFCRFQYNLLCQAVGSTPEADLPQMIKDRFPTNSPLDFASRMIYFFCGIHTRKTLGANTPEGATARAKWKAMLELEKVYG